ncbi:MAG: metal ABC transporter substrate-binding protein [bacterium]|nr:metal ABC transporter substrate-binding protein [bacterium]
MFYSSEKEDGVMNTNKIKFIIKFIMRFIKEHAFLIISLSSLIISSRSYAREINVVAPICSFGSIAKSILGQNAKVQILADGRFDLHRVEPRPSFLAYLAKADYVLPVGMRLDTWFISLIDASRNSRIYPGSPGFIVLYDKVKILEIPAFKPGEARAGDIHPEGNPHYWLSPDNALIIAETIAKTISAQIPESEHIYQNYLKFKADIENLKTELKQIFSQFRGSEAIAYHNSWRYLEDFLGFEVKEFLEPAPGIPPTPSQIEKVINLIKQRNIKIIIYEPFQPTSPVESVSRRTGTKAVELYQDCVPKLDYAKDYFSLLRYNTKKLIESLK